MNKFTKKKSVARRKRPFMVLEMVLIYLGLYFALSLEYIEVDPAVPVLP